MRRVAERLAGLEPPRALERHRETVHRALNLRRPHPLTIRLHTTGHQLRSAAHARRPARYSGYVGIPLPRNIETPLVPATARRPANRAGGGEYMFGLNERAKLPAGAIARPAVVDPADGKIPLRPEALARRKEIMSRQSQLEYLDGRVMCLEPGVPRITVPQVVVGYQIFQKPGYVVIFYEQSHLYRSIPLDNRQPLDPAIRKGLGVSRGHWEGNTLVVEVTNFTPTSRTTGPSPHRVTTGRSGRSRWRAGTASRIATPIV